MLTAGFESAIPASERPQTHALNRAATGIDATGRHEELYMPDFSYYKYRERKFSVNCEQSSSRKTTSKVGENI